MKTQWTESGDYRKEGLQRKEAWLADLRLYYTRAEDMLVMSSVQFGTGAPEIHLASGRCMSIWWMPGGHQGPGAELVDLTNLTETDLMLLYYSHRVTDRLRQVIGMQFFAGK